MASTNTPSFTTLQGSRTIAKPHHPFLPALSHLHTAALTVLPHSPLLAAQLSSSLDALASSKELNLNPSILRTYCPACSNVMIPGWTMAVRSGGIEDNSKSKRQARRDRKGSKSGKSKEGEAGTAILEKDIGKSDVSSRTKASKRITYACLVCSHKSEMPLPDPPPVRKQKKAPQKLEAQAATPIATSATPSAVPVQENSGASSSQSTAKARAKKRKQGGLLAELEAQKKRRMEEEEWKKRNPGLGGRLGGLGLLDLMKLDS